MENYNNTILSAIKVLSRTAKLLSKSKNGLYAKGEHMACNEAKVFSALYYELKAAALQRAEKDGLVQFVGLTVQTFYYYYYDDEIGLGDDDLVFIDDGDGNEYYRREINISLQTFRSGDGTIFHLPNPDARGGAVLAEVEGELPFSTKTYDQEEIENAVVLLGKYIGEDPMVQCCQRAAKKSRDVPKFFEKMVTIFPEMEKYHRKELIYACLDPGNEKNGIKVVYQDGFWGLAGRFNRDEYEERKTLGPWSLPNDYWGLSDDYIGEEKWKEELGTDIIAEAYATWAASFHNRIFLSVYRGSKDPYPTDEVILANNDKTTKAWILNYRVGRGEFIEFTTRKDEEAYFLRKFKKILEEREITIDDFSLPEIDPVREAAIMAEYPETIDIRGQIFPLYYYREGEQLIVYTNVGVQTSQGRVIYYADSDLEKFTSMFKDESSLDKLFSLPSGIQIYADKEKKLLSSLFAWKLSERMKDYF